MKTDALSTPWPQFPGGPSTAAAGASSAAGGGAGERAKVVELVREFEAFFLRQMLRQMRESMLDEEDKDGLGADTLTDTMDVELAGQLARSGGIGLTRMLEPAVSRAVLGEGTSTARSKTSMAYPGAFPASALGTPSAMTAVPVTPTAPHTEGEDAAAVPFPLPAALSSPFGFRTDPIDRTWRFHAGIDIQAAYGREVPAAGAGEVVYSGAQGGYGNTVVVEHPGGVRTRYAHLSSIQVTAGTRVDAGTVLGRVGSSGRSTGPHLHFEVLQDGHPVNPEIAATRYAGLLKIGGGVADLPGSQPSMTGVAVGVDDEDSGQ